MVKKLTKLGTSHSIIIDKSIMQLLSITPDTPLEVRTDGKSLIITPLGEDVNDELFDNALDKSIRKFGNVYKKLAQ